MISVQEALQQCLALELPKRILSLPVSQVYGYRSAHTLYAKVPLPSWDQSAMDGFAVSMFETQQTLDVVEVIAAGQWPTLEIKPGQCARIMTGAPMPKGADLVVIQENCIYNADLKKLTLYPDADPDHLISFLKEGANVRKEGEETQIGDLICQSGQHLHSGMLGYIASQGWTHIDVFDSLRVALISTGDEVIESGFDRKPGQIYGTNQVMLQGLVEQAGGRVFFKEHAVDTPESVRSVFEDALHAQVDVIISTGGVSVGDFDPVKGVLADLEANLAFWKVKMKPGKPLAVGQIGSTPFFALPGNPVSCVVSFFLFLWPFFQKAHGAHIDQAHLPRHVYTLADEVRKTHQRAEFMRVRFLDSKTVTLTGGQSSGWVSSLASAEGLIELPAHPVDLKKGDQVQVLVLPWSSRNFR
jgi:molybdopterin molybdotransferase